MMAIRDPTDFTNVTNATSPRPTSNSSEVDFFKLFFRIIYCIVLIVGLFGNLLTCYAIITTNFMRRAIHFYTFNLAAADLIILLMYVPSQMVRNEHDMQWTLGNSLCHVNHCLIPTSLMVSIGTLVAITLDRHRGITQPFLWRGDSRRPIKIVIPLIWCFSIISSAPVTAFATLKENPSGSKKYYCYEDWNSKSEERTYWTIIALIQVVIPLSIIAVANIHMLIVMLKDSDSSAHKTHNKKMVKMMITLVLVYVVCSAPQHIVFFWLSFGNPQESKEAKVIVKMSNLLPILQAAVNPVIYGISRHDLKHSFRNILKSTSICAFFRERLDHNFSSFERTGNPWKSRMESTYVTDTPPLTKRDEAQAKLREFSTPEKEVVLKNGTRKMRPLIVSNGHPPIDELFPSKPDQPVTDCTVNDKQENDMSMASVSIKTVEVCLGDNDSVISVYDDMLYIYHDRSMNKGFLSQSPGTNI